MNKGVMLILICTALINYSYSIHKLLLLFISFDILHPIPTTILHTFITLFNYSIMVFYTCAA